MFNNWKNSKEKNLQYGGLSADVLEAPELERGNVIGFAFFALKSLWSGMKITFSYIISPKTIVTQQYPENRDTLKLPERYRHNLRLKYDSDNFHNCTGCKICEMNCPNTSIIIETEKGEISKKKEVDSYIWRQDSCTLCNICVLVCPFDALEWTSEFESSVHDRRLLISQLNKYSGPPAKVIAKMDDEKKQAQIDLIENSKREKYFGAKLPMAGTPMPGVSKLSEPMDKKGGGLAHD